MLRRRIDAKTKNMIKTLASLLSCVAYSWLYIRYLRDPVARRRTTIERLEEDVRRIEEDILKPIECVVATTAARGHKPRAGCHKPTALTLDEGYGKRLDLSIDLIGHKIQLAKMSALVEMEQTTRRARERSRMSHAGAGPWKSGSRIPYVVVGCVMFVVAVGSGILVYSLGVDYDRRL